MNGLLSVHGILVYKMVGLFLIYKVWLCKPLSGLLVNRKGLRKCEKKFFLKPFNIQRQKKANINNK